MGTAVRERSQSDFEGIYHSFFDLNLRVGGVRGVAQAEA